MVYKLLFLVGVGNLFYAAEACANGPPLVPAPRANQSLAWLRTSDGVEFAVRGDKPASARPCVLVLAGSADESLHPSSTPECSRILGNDDYVCASLDLPCHGKQRRPDEPEGLAGWRYRIDRGEDPLAEFKDRLGRVIDELVNRGFANPQQIAICGVSRGGFAAMHFAASEPRIKSIVCYAPVTDLRVLREFKGTEQSRLVQQLSLFSEAEQLADRPLFITVGDRDDRVSTEKVIEFARLLSATSARKHVPCQVELHVCPADGHRAPADAAEHSAAWLKRTLEK